MTSSGRHWINTFVCAAVVAHAVYWLLSGRLDGATAVRTGLIYAEIIVGLIGVVWFWRRARGTSPKTTDQANDDQERRP